MVKGVVCVCVRVYVYVCAPGAEISANMVVCRFVVENNDCVCVSVCVCLCMRVMQTSDLGEVADEIPCTECHVVVHVLYILCMSSYIYRDIFLLAQRYLLPASPR